MSQTSYNLEQGVGVAGGLADTNPTERNTYNNPNQAIPFGRGVAKISGDDDGIDLPSSSTDDIVGITLRDLTTVNDQYAQNSACGVLKVGKIYVEVEEAVTPDDDVYIRYDGKAQVQVITFDSNFVTGNVIGLDIDGVSMTNVNFTTNHNITMTRLATQITTDFSQIATAVADATARTITLTAASKGSDGEFSVENITVTGGATQPTGTVSESIASVDTADAGLFRTDGDSSTALQVGGARYMSSAEAGEVAIVNLNLS